MAHQKVKVEKDGAERYLLTYADLMNLLLILFIILYSMSQVDAAKFNQLATSLSSAFGDGNPATVMMMQGGAGNSLINMDANAATSVISSTMERQQMQEVKDAVTQMVEEQKLQGQVDVSMQERGVVISIKERVLFKSGSALIEAASIQTITGIGKVLLSITSNHIRVEGHTDSDPISNALFASNWELSSARATTVLRKLVDSSGINPKIISAVGYGEFTPKLPNTTAENKAANRRVDIVILKSIYEKSESGVGSSPEQAPETLLQKPAPVAVITSTAGKVDVRLNDYVATNANDTSNGQEIALRKITEITKSNPDVNSIVLQWNVIKNNDRVQEAIVYDRKNKKFYHYLKTSQDKVWSKSTYENISDITISKAGTIGEGFGQEYTNKTFDIDKIKE